MARGYQNLASHIIDVDPVDFAKPPQRSLVDVPRLPLPANRGEVSRGTRMFFRVRGDSAEIHVREIFSNPFNVLGYRSENGLLQMSSELEPTRT